MQKQHIQKSLLTSQYSPILSTGVMFVSHFYLLHVM